MNVLILHIVFMANLAEKIAVLRAESTVEDSYALQKEKYIENLSTFTQMSGHLHNCKLTSPIISFLPFFIHI